MGACLVRPNETCFLYPHVIHVLVFCLSIVYPYLAHLFMCKIIYCFYHPFSDPVLINIGNDISLIHVLLYSFILSYTIHTFMVYIHGYPSRNAPVGPPHHVLARFPEGCLSSAPWSSFKNQGI